MAMASGLATTGTIAASASRSERSSPSTSGAETTPGADAGCPAGCLFDLAADPGEHIDLKGAQPERFAAMRARLASWGATVYQTNYSDVDDDAACLDTDALLARYGGFLGPPCGLGAVR